MDFLQKKSFLQKKMEDTFIDELSSSSEEDIEDIQCIPRALTKNLAKLKEQKEKDQEEKESRVIVSPAHCADYDEHSDLIFPPFDVSSTIGSDPQFKFLNIPGQSAPNEGTPFDEFHPNQCHQKKKYNVTISLARSVFLSDSAMGNVENTKNPRRFILVVYLGSMTRIHRSFRSAVVSSSKKWFDILDDVPSKYHPLLVDFSLNFSQLTSKQRKGIPFRMYAQLQCFTAEKNVFVAQTNSLPFYIFSHSKQYHYVPQTQCVLCKRSFTSQEENSQHEKKKLKIKN